MKIPRKLVLPLAGFMMIEISYSPFHIELVAKEHLAEEPLETRPIKNVYTATTFAITTTVSTSTSTATILP